MNSEEAKRIVSEGLARRKEDRALAEKEARLEQYEQDMIDACNIHCADAKTQRKLEETGRLSRQMAKSRREARAQARAIEEQKEEQAIEAVKSYLYICGGILLVTAWTSFPTYAAFALIAGLAVFPAAYVFRLYYPM